MASDEDRAASVYRSASGKSIAEDARAMVERTRREQGLPPTVEDPAVIAKIRAILYGEPNRHPMSKKERLALAADTRRQKEAEAKKAAERRAAEVRKRETERAEIVAAWERAGCSTEQIDMFKAILEWPL